jgi:hypothetical protein
LRFQEIKVSFFQDFNTSNLWVTRIQGLKVNLEIKVSRFRSFKVSKFLKLKVFRFQGSKVSRFQFGSEPTLSDF